MPDEARAVAKELGIAYYETSVFTYFGVNEVFENAIRAALIARRQQRFWMTNVKITQILTIFPRTYCILSLTVETRSTSPSAITISATETNSSR